MDPKILDGELRTPTFEDYTGVPENDPVNHPDHYTNHPSGVECIEIVKHLDFCLGGAIKYIWRHNDKGRPIQDLKKAIWLINKKIEMLEDEAK